MRERHAFGRPNASRAVVDFLKPVNAAAPRRASGSMIPTARRLHALSLRRLRLCVTRDDGRAVAGHDGEALSTRVVLAERVAALVKSFSHRGARLPTMCARPRRGNAPLDVTQRPVCTAATIKSVCRERKAGI